MTRTGLIILTLFLLTLSAQARDLSLADALKLAEEHSASLQISEAQQMAAEARLAAAKAERLPTLSASLSTSYISDLSKIEFDIPMITTPPKEIGTHEHYQADFTLSLPVFAGGRIGQAIKSGEAKTTQLEAVREQVRDQVLYATRSLYFSLVQAEEQVKLAQASMDRTKVIQKDVQAKYDAGVVDSLAMIDVALARERIDFQIQQAKSASLQVSIQLARLVGWAGESVTPTLNTNDMPKTYPFNDELKTDTDQLPSVRAERANVDFSTSEFKRARAEYWPTVSIFAGYSYGKPNIDQFGGDWSDYYTVGAKLGWSFNLGDRIGKTSRAQKHAVDISRTALRDQEEASREQISLAHSQMILALKKMMSASKELELGQRNYELASTQHRAGAISTNRLLEIEAELTAFEIQKTSSEVALQIAISKYYWAIGSDKLAEGW